MYGKSDKKYNILPPTTQFLYFLNNSDDNISIYFYYIINTAKHQIWGVPLVLVEWQILYIRGFPLVL